MMIQFGGIVVTNQTASQPAKEKTTSMVLELNILRIRSAFLA